MSELHITDHLDRVVMAVLNGKIAITRHPCMEDNLKKSIANIYSELTGDNKEDVLSFLNYEEENEMFCS